MPPQLPQFVEPLRLARQGTQLQGKLPLVAMSRLQQAVHETQGDVEIELEFRREANGIHCIIGSFSTVVGMVCQRCLQFMPVTLSGDIRLGIVRGEQEAEQLPGEYEPLQVVDDPLKLQDLVEDELLLALPIAPRHRESQCPAARTQTSQTDPSVSTERQYPFSELAALKRHKD